MARKTTVCRPGSRRGPRNGTGPRGGTAACPVTRAKRAAKRKGFATGAIITLVLMGIGAGQLSFLVGMDAQTVKLQNAGQCDSRHYVYGVYPKFNKESGKIERIEYKSTCADWAKRF